MRIRTPRDLGLVIKERRRALGLDQATLATRVGVSRQWIVGMERGKRTVELALALRTLNALDVRLSARADETPPGHSMIDAIADGESS